MTPKQAAKEIVALLKEAEAKGAAPASVALRAFLEELAKAPGLRKPRVRKAKTLSARDSQSATSRVGDRAKRPTEAEMAKTIEELAKKLNDAFNSDERFEAVLREPETQALSKPNIVTLYRAIFNKRPSSSLSKPEIFNAMRKARIRQVRGQS